ncbi:amidohydrolase [Brevundimonas sp. Leaf363]|uniref:amidohydrolase family protein n=1 Tax=Brevundimonas sp. Leaf363 TaxID=1736353 RepID=UPI0006F666DC|nr:amidohydrolase family protein [Brevundimonas sp. Leaf363]KQS53863.1 amidohydrolase [Brevundimonas sp. Leaf363]
MIFNTRWSVVRATPFAVLAGLALSACATTPPAGYTASDFASVRKIDSHVHVNLQDDAFVDQAAADNFEILSINVDYPAFPSLADQQQVAHHYAAADPQRFHFATTFSMQGFGQAGWAERANAAIDAEVARGAVAVKVWKNVGMVERDASGQLIFIDDAGLNPIFSHLAATGVPLIAHQGEPYNCWLPLDQMTTDNDRAYFSAHPEYHMYLHPEMPRYEYLMARRDTMVSRNPTLKFVGAHMASLEWSVDEMSKFLDAHPNAVIETAARMTQIQYQSVRDRRKVRDFFIKYQDRILYGTDLTLNPGEDVAAFRQSAHEVWTNDWAYLATDAMRHVDDIDADVTGLALPRSVIDKIYYANAQREFFSRR